MPVPTFTLLELKQAFEAIGMSTGDAVVMHSALPGIGKVEGVPLRENPKAVFETVLEFLGPQGTLAVPAPDWDYGRKASPFDLHLSPVTKNLGVISAYAASRPGSSRSPNPIFSLAAVGLQAGFICKGGTTTAFGVDSAWDRLFQLDADMLFLGCALLPTSFTFARYVEQRFGVPYLYSKLFMTDILDNGSLVAHHSVTLLRYGHCKVHYNFDALTQRFRDAGILRETVLGGGPVLALRMGNAFKVAVECLKENIHFFLESPPPYDQSQVPVL
ncbi:MAG: AAC(3) family N-acetyltransferase [Alphaproteobacteria bacterium]|nr:AAC(3) family N-acetyltransferase [Alphaproteobacteria bacterium]